MTHTWTNMKINGEVHFSTNALKTHVTAETLEGKMTLSVKELRAKANDRDVLPMVRRVYQDMLDYLESLE